MNRGKYTRYFSEVISLMMFSALFPAQAAQFPCTVAGQPSVIHDTNGNNMPDPAPGDIAYSMVYDTGPGPNLPGFEILSTPPGATAPGPYPVSATSAQVNLNILGNLTTFSKACGSPAFNDANVNWFGLNNTVSGRLVDTNNDRIADAISLLIDFSWYPALAGILFDMPLEYYPNAAMPTHFKVPDPISTPAGPLFHGGAWFIPVDASTRSMVLDCPGGIGPFPINDTAYASSGRGCLGSAIPLTGGPGSALLILGLFAAGIWAMRRGGMGRDMALG